ncbi:hypothetical protein SAMN06265347_104103 [Halobellus salinus]|nr:hypothetical protein SAMN06265347_104103 [Halobellus salinus]
MFAPGDDDDDVSINVSGEALKINNCLTSRVCVKIGGEESTISVTLTPDDAEALRGRLADAIDESGDALARWLENGGIDRRR